MSTPPLTVGLPPRCANLGCSDLATSNFQVSPEKFPQKFQRDGNKPLFSPMC
jgi:hypothetical protein